MANSRSGESVVERIIKLLSAFGRTKPRLTVSALARETGLPSSTVHRLAAELCDVGFLNRDDEGRGASDRECGNLPPVRTHWKSSGSAVVQCSKVFKKPCDRMSRCRCHLSRTTPCCMWNASTNMAP